MKAKLGKLKAIETTQYNGYKGLLKKKILAGLSQPDMILDYLLIDSEMLSWNGESPTDDQPLFYLGQTTSWKKDIKASKDMTLKNYSYGQCKLIQVGTSVQVALCPEKGKLTQAALLKPIKKIFKTFKPKVFFEVVANLDEVETLASEDGSEGQSSKNTSTGLEGTDLLTSIGTDLHKYHLAVNKIKAALKGASTQEEKMPLQVKQSKVLKRLKHLCDAWKTDIEPQAKTLIVDKESETWQKIYQNWKVFFAKRKEAKTGDSSNEDAVKAEEERIYTKALADLEHFQNNLEKGDLIDPSVIESNIENLEQHLAQWKAFVKDKKVAFPEELKALEEILAEMRSDWKTFKPLMENYHKKAAALDKALEGADVDLVNALYEELESINEQIASLA